VYRFKRHIPKNVKSPLANHNMCEKVYRYSFVASRLTKIVTNPEVVMENENAITRTGTWVRNIFKVNQDAAAKPRTLAGRLFKVMARVSIALMALYVVASLAWRYSGSNRWEFTGERDGVKIYTLKAPGTDLIQVKGVVRLRTTLGGVINLLYGTFDSNDYGYKGQHIIERVDPHLEYSGFRLDFPFPFQTREFVVRTHLVQHPRTKEVLIVTAAAPDKEPPDDCCFRVTEMNNTWRFTPLENGQVELEYINNTNMGGFMPALMMNKFKVKIVAGALSKMQGYLEKRNYQNSRHSLIEEK
jgi:hypothetical protein